MNSLQQPTVCVYLNHVSNVKRLTEKLLSSRQDTPTVVIFLINLGSERRQQSRLSLDSLSFGQR